MFDRMTWFQCARQAAQGSRPATRRTRRGSVLILVMAVLGILFVTGVAFMTTMNFEARLIRTEQQADQDEASLELIEQMTGIALTAAFIETAGVNGGADALGEMTTLRGGAEGFRANPLAFAEMPAVHSLISQVEPYDNPVIFGYFTDLEVLQKGPFYEADMFRTVDPSGRFGEWGDPDDLLGHRAPVDSDGDGIVDTLQVDMSELDLPRSQLAELARVVNDPENPSEKVYLGLRVIPHGAMVNLNDSHPNLIDPERGGIMDPNRGSVPAWSKGQRPYSPAVEEASLRRRVNLPPRVVPSSAIQGNPSDPTPDPPGGGDFGSQLFPPPNLMFPTGETVRTDEHRYWYYDRSDGYDEWDIWSARMRPSVGPEYDRRHLSTTISHDDNLTRGTQLVIGDGITVPLQKVDVVERMKDLVREDLGLGGTCESLRFQYIAYPHTLASGYWTESGPGGQLYGDPYTWCDCEDDFDCAHDLRKGRLRLSLPWLDTAVAEGHLTPEERIQIIQEAFMMMLMNARGPEWGFFNPIDTDGDGTPDDHAWSHTFQVIARQAASLTANMIDFMDKAADGNEVPTRVEIRSADFTAAGLPQVGLGTGEYVYGLERQPFITEIVAQVNDDDPDDGLPDPDSVYALELFNPYDVPFPGLVFFLRVTETGPDILITQPIPAHGYLVVYNPPGEVVLSLGNIPKESVPSLAFSNFSRIYLLRTDPEDLGKRIVLDQFEVGGDVARVTQGQEGTLQSQERAAVARFAGVGNLVSPWYAPIPAVDESFEGDHSLGQDNALATLDPGVRPVEVLFADTGRLSEDEASAIPASFPTTGSMLLLMRYANRPMSDNPPDYKYAFTSHLRSGPGSVVQAQYQIDNGRMPVFDTGMVHHYDPAFDPITGLQWPVRRPGELAHLPWGQFVFDYFTALPLSNPGPYRDESTSSIDPGARPRVDQDGLRVHGRININAAPWKVLSGLPFVPLEDIPAAFRTTFGVTLALVDNNGLAIADDDAGWLGEERAKAIVAYREARKVSGLDAGGNLFTTGDYGDDPTAQGRGWTRDIPMARRGTGFMTVGELANVRNAGATSDLYKLDSGKLDDTSATYLEAIAVLASLGDWVTARSHVFTIYGTLRGQEDQTIVDPNLEVQTRLRAEDVDSRAIRFQETVDRLPTFMGEHQPVRVGDRVVGKYRDTLND